MPMIDVQRRHQTIFRIRFGEKLGNRPTKLTDAIRITSANPSVVDAFIDVYGGSRVEWEGQWEAKLPTTSLNILVLPGQSISQWWEKYRGSVCDRRCDGKLETKSGKPCMCDPDVETRTANRNDCSPTTRVSVICPDVAVVGSGMFVCHGLVGAETLPQSIAVAEAALSRGLMVPAVLRVVEFRGRNHFIVPQIEVVGMSFNALAAAAENGQLQHATRPELDAPANGNGNGSGGPRFTPIQAPAIDADSRSMRDQFGEFEEQSDTKAQARAGRSNATAPIPSTGIQPKRRSEVETLEPEVSAAVPAAVDAEEPGGDALPPPGAPTSPSASSVNRVAIAAREAGMDDDGRHNLSSWASGGRVTSSKLLTEHEQVAAIDACHKIGAGTHLLSQHDDGKWVLLDSKFRFASDDPATGSSYPVTVEGVPSLSAAEISAMKGPDLVIALRERGLQVGGLVEEMKVRLMESCGVGDEPFA